MPLRKEASFYMTKAQRFEKLTSTAELKRDLRGRSVRAAAFSGASTAFDLAIRIGSTAVLARLVLPQHFGLVMMVSAATSIGDQLRELGLSEATVQRKEITHEEVSNLFWVNCLAGLLIATMICVLSPALAGYYKESRLVGITCALATNCIFGGLMVQHQALLSRQLKLGYTSAVRLSSSLISTLLAIILAWHGFGYWALVWREVSRGALLTAGMWLCCPWIPSLPCLGTNVRTLVNFGAHLTGANILSALSAGVDRLLIGAYWGPGPVAMYRQAFQLISAPLEQLLGPVCHVGGPALSRVQTDGSRYRRVYDRILTIGSLATMPSALFAAIYSKQITAIVLGGKWADSAQILMVLSLGTFIKQAAWTPALVLITSGRSKDYLYITAAQNAALIVAMFIGVRWGTIGVAVADVSTAYLLLFPRLYYCFKGSPITIRNFFSTITVPAAASLVMALVLLLFRHQTLEAAPAVSLALGGLVAVIVFATTWITIPGGAEKLRSLIGDIQSALAKKTATSSTEIPITTA